jgi:hypothetical protein
MRRITALLTAALAVAAVGGTAGTAVARQGADDPVGHVRHSGGADDTRATSARRHHRHAARHARGADDAVGHVRHSGADDAPNHG